MARKYKNVYQDYISEAIEHFVIDCDPYGIMVNNKCEIEKVYVDESNYTYKRIMNTLSTQKGTPNLSSYKKAFALPGCPVSQDRLKAALKEHNIILTNDYDAADVLLSHDKLEVSHWNGEKIQTTKLFVKLENFSSCDEGCNSIEEYCNDPDNMRSGETARVIWCDNVENSINTYSTDSLEFPYDGFLLTPLAVNLAWYVETGALDVINVEEVLCQSATKITVDAQLISDLKSLLSDYDDTNNLMASKLLPTIDYNKELHLMWQLSQEIGGNLHKLRNDKDVQYWLGVSQIEDYYHHTALDFINHLTKIKKLNRRYFRYLEPIVRKEIRIENRDLYVFKVELKPEYKQYLKKDEKQSN